jgi:steroid 5-alpha reductase family enzyme
MDPVLRNAIVACASVAALCWVLSVMTREYSWVDRLWSILPPCYVAYFAYEGGFDARLVLMTACAVAWGARLTWNFARKGGYAKGGEDYRWAELRRRMSPALFQVFNVLFVSGFQNAVLLAIALPAWAVSTHRGAPLGPLDACAALAFVAFLAIETVADQEQWRFQSDKKARRARGEPIASEFATRGLFRYSRHPNFFAEQAMWWSFYLFAVASGAAWLHPTITGAVVLTALFQGSTNFTEELTLAKYPSYADYKRRTSRLVPLPPRT